MRGGDLFSGESGSTRLAEVDVLRSPCVLLVVLHFVLNHFPVGIAPHAPLEHERRFALCQSLAPACRST